MVIKYTAVTAILALALPALAAEGEKNYTFELSANPSPSANNAASTFSLTIAPKTGWVLKNETPFKVTLSASDGLELAQQKFSSKDFKDPKATSKTIATTFKASANGEQKISADLTFFLCSKEICQRFKDTAELGVQIK